MNIELAERNEVQPSVDIPLRRDDFHSAVRHRLAVAFDVPHQKSPVRFTPNDALLESPSVAHQFPTRNPICSEADDTLPRAVHQFLLERFEGDQCKVNDSGAVVHDLPALSIPTSTMSTSPQEFMDFRTSVFELSGEQIATLAVSIPTAFFPKRLGLKNNGLVVEGPYRGWILHVVGLNTFLENSSSANASQSEAYPVLARQSTITDEQMQLIDTKLEAVSW